MIDYYYYYVNTNEMQGELSLENIISSHVNYRRCYGYIMNRAFCNDLVFHWCLYNKQNVTWPLGDTKFLFSC